MDIKLGKLPAKVDKRTIRLKSIIRKELLPPLPEAFNIDDDLGGVEDDNMYANDQYGNCVIAARAHQTLRYEKFEQGTLIPITDQEVIDQYFKESGGLDMGLILLNSLKSWRRDGWIAGGKHYDIYAFASVDWKDHEEVKHCIHLLGGVNFGMMVYAKDLEQFQNGETWELTPNSGSFKGGHGVYLYAYGFDGEGLICMTWGKRQKMTWRFWDARLDEAYGIVDNKNEWMHDTSPVDVEKLQGYLDEITEDGGQEPSECPIARAYVDFGNFMARLLRRTSRIRPPIRGK
jgi:hypothetical protein